MQDGDEGDGETQREKPCFPLPASQDSQKWNACHEPQHMVRKSMYRTAESAPRIQVTSAAWTWLISLDPAHTIKHNLLPLLRAVVNIYHRHIHVFQGSFSKPAADVTKPQNSCVLYIHEDTVKQGCELTVQLSRLLQTAPVFSVQLQCLSCWTFHSPHSH